MIDELLQQDRELKRAKINSETATIRWRELQRFFAAGKVMLISTELDLVDVAYAFEQDEVDRVRQWTGAMHIAAVTDEQARNWLEADASLWAVVVKPWVLVQEIR